MKSFGLPSQINKEGQHFVSMDHGHLIGCVSYFCHLVFHPRLCWREVCRIGNYYGKCSKARPSFRFTFTHNTVALNALIYVQIKKWMKKKKNKTSNVSEEIQHERLPRSFMLYLCCASVLFYFLGEHKFLKKVLRVQKWV